MSKIKRNSALFERWKTFNKGMDPEGVKLSFASHLEYSLAKDQYTATLRDLYQALALTGRDRMVERWIRTQQTYYESDCKRVYYLSAEYLIGRMLVNNLINLGIYEQSRAALAELELELDLESLVEQEPDAGLGNGGLGRLAACFLDSMAAMEIPAYGYGIRYEFGIFEQAIRNGAQVELPDTWLKFGNPWEIPRPERSYEVHFYGHVEHSEDLTGLPVARWVDTHTVVGTAYDTPIDGYDNESVNTLRLWAARASQEFDLAYFQHGDYLKAVEEKNLSENISKVLYPNDSFFEGQELRLKQQYFFVSCSIQDIVRRYLVGHSDFDSFPDKAAIQLNDTHPSLAVAELMRILIDVHHLEWDKAWEISQRSLAYTNHTLLAEALERWPVSMLGNLLPRHLEIIYEINARFLREVSLAHPGDQERIARMSLIEEGADKKVRMAHLAIVGSHSVNGVSKLHTQLLTERELADFHQMFPGRFNNKTNGITPRRWLLAANPELATLVSETLGGPAWTSHAQLLEGLLPLAEDSAFRERFDAIKRDNKQRLATTIRRVTDISVDPASLFDVQIKRIHEYKRQLLNVLAIIARWLDLKDNGAGDAPPRTYIFGGKAAPSYTAAKMVIRLICRVADMLNRDETTNQQIKVVFVPNYRVSLAEQLIPASDVSEQISTAGFEASGTGNMKFMMNGALTIGTLDGANVEIHQQVGDEHIFLFGLDAAQVSAPRAHYDPRAAYEGCPQLKRAVDLVLDDFFSAGDPGLFHPLVGSLLERDHYLVFEDFADYYACQGRVGQAYLDRDRWLRSAVINVARSGVFSSDRTIADYNRDIWKAPPISVTRD